jgi:hypothetical protein
LAFHVPVWVCRYIGDSELDAQAKDRALINEPTEIRKRAEDKSTSAYVCDALSKCAMENSVAGQGQSVSSHFATALLTGAAILSLCPPALADPAPASHNARQKTANMWTRR